MPASNSSPLWRTAASAEELARVAEIEAQVERLTMERAIIANRAHQRAQHQRRKEKANETR
jgi:hypothetical protein